MKRSLLTLFVAVILSGLAFAEEKVDAVSRATPRHAMDRAALKNLVSGKKILVVYYSPSGNIERVAKDIAECFGADIEEITDKKSRKGLLGSMGGGMDAAFKRLTEIGPAKLDPSGYDITIIGTPVWSWAMTPAVRTYITENKNKFKELAFFIFAPGGIPAENVVPSMETLSGKKCIAYAGFSSRELKNNGRYWSRLTRFLESFRQK